MNCVNIFSPRYLVYNTSVVLFVFGVILIGMGVHCQMMPEKPVPIAQGAIVLGFIACLTAVVGALASKLGQVWLIILNGIIIMCLFGAAVALGVIGLTTTSEYSIKSFLRTFYATKDKSKFEPYVHKFHNYYECCGYDGPFGKDVLREDEVFLEKGNKKLEAQKVTVIIPECCKEAVPVCTILDAYAHSCFNKMTNKQRDWSKILGVILIFTAFNIGIVLYTYVHRISIS
ncbi:uncharacterized protein LOC115878037 [Sitophilus oryzae]|uniref:Uncharacterized protein LOC115878037 n=1 Tax=Sitophilus oryzae TaxID=7048 RepID=A0A6J2XHT4_SITOR|nr:uncharacterized protein LOC115878037 [Sitophilus oryzae]